MKILLATTVFKLNGGGIASYNNELYDIFNNEHTIHLLTTDSSEVGTCVDNIFRISPNATWDYKYYVNLVGQLNSEQYDLIINSDSEFVAVVAPFLNAPIITISHSYNNLPTLRATYNHRYNSKMIALSHAGRKFMIDFFRIKNVGKIEMVYNFVKDDLSYNIKDKSERDELIIVYPGGASLMKYPEMVLLAVNLLVKTNLKFKFYWLGGTTLPLSKFSLPKTIEQLIPKDERVVVTNKVPRDEAERIISNANIFILPSRAEGCPVSLMEALRSGCIPIVGDAKHVCREILEDGKMGKIVKQGSHKDLYVAIKDLIENHSRNKGEYTKSLQYSMTVLAQTVWKEKMIRIIEYAVKSDKEVRPFKIKTLYKSLVGYKLLAFYIGFKERWLSVKCYVKFNYYYLKMKLS